MYSQITVKDSMHAFENVNVSVENFVHLRGLDLSYLYISGPRSALYFSRLVQTILVDQYRLFWQTSIDYFSRLVYNRLFLKTSNRLFQQTSIQQTILEDQYRLFQKTSIGYFRRLVYTILEDQYTVDYFSRLVQTILVDQYTVDYFRRLDQPTSAWALNQSLAGMYIVHCTCQEQFSCV